MGVGESNGKLILFGEHAAVYGHPALGIGLPRTLRITLSPVDGSQWVLPVLPESATNLIVRAIAKLPSVLDHEVTAHELTISGTLPMSVGLGSSAAFCIALLRAAAPERFAVHTEIATLWPLAHRLESVFHGTPSGIDTGLCLIPGASLLTPHPPAIPDAQPVDLPACTIVAGAVPRVSSTGELVEGIRKRRKSDPDSINRIMDELAEIASEAAGIGFRGGESPDARDLGRLASRAHEILSDLGLCIPAVEKGLQILGDHGSVGGKMSGGGGGGAFFGVFDDQKKASSASVELERWLGREQTLPTGPFVEVVTAGQAPAVV